MAHYFECPSCNAATDFDPHDREDNPQRFCDRCGEEYCCRCLSDDGVCDTCLDEVYDEDQGGDEETFYLDDEDAD